MVTKDQIIGTVWRLFDLQPRPIPAACNMAMDMYGKELAMDYRKWYESSGYNDAAYAEHELFDIYLRERHQSNPK